MSFYIALPLLTLFALSEVAVAPMFRVAGLQPNLVLVLLTAWLIQRGPRETFVLIPVAGVLLGLVDGAPLGTALLALAPLALLQDVRGSQLSEGGLIMAIIFVVLMTLAYNLIYLLVFTLQGEAASWLVAITRVIIPTVLLNLAVILPCYAVLSLFSQDLRRPSYA